MSYRQRAKDLIELALDEGASEAERLSAALKAAKLIRKYDLLSSPLDLIESENETIQAVKGIFETLSNPKLVKNVKKVGERLGVRRRRRT